MRPHGACDRCLARTWLLSRLAAHLEVARGVIGETMALDDEPLIEAVAGRDAGKVRTELLKFDPETARERAAHAELELICRCERRYPDRLRELAAPPAVLHVRGGLERFLELVGADPVAVVGARRASPYGLDVARSLARGLAAAGVTVLSGMAFGIDSAAHGGALELGGPTVAVLPGGADRPYPAGKADLYRRIRRQNAVISELAPSSAVWRWTFPARNRIIAALSVLTIVVEAGDRSGSLVTARIARSLGRPLGAVPGRITSPLARGPNRLIVDGARLIATPEDALELLFGGGARERMHHAGPALDLESSALLAALGDGDDPSAACARAGLDIDRGLAALAELELGGYVRREAGGRFSVVA